jgi:hypothetical protein
MTNGVGDDDLDSRVRRVVATLPPLAAKLDEVETVLNRPVVFAVEDALGAIAGGRATCPEGRIVLARTSVENLSVLGEEIMHLHRCTSGYPMIVPGAQAALLGYRAHLQALSGFFDERTAFPFLEQLGLDPRAVITPRLGATANSIEAQMAQIEHDGTTEFFRVVLGTIYVQAALMAPASPEQTRLLAIFDRGALHPYRTVGRNLCAAIDLSADRSPDDVEQYMTQSVRDFVSLPVAAATVERRF